MATKKSNPAVAARKAARQKFVSEKVASKGITAKQARQRFFVQTRMAEMKAKGKTVTPEMRKQLQQKFQSGDVARKGFAAPKKKSGGASSSSSSMVPKVTGVKTSGDQPVRVGVGTRASGATRSGSSGYTRADSLNPKSQYGPLNPKPSVSGFPKGASKSNTVVPKAPVAPAKPKDTRSFGQRVAEANKSKVAVKPNKKLLMR